MTRPRFSIVIPTRNREHTLRHTLKTVLNQSFDDFEVVVSDNCSSDGTKETALGLSSPHIRYVCTDKPLAMTDSWEFAVSQARGEFTTVLGDDDGLLEGSLGVADTFLRESGCRALRWDSVMYWWPSCPPEIANRLVLPVQSQSRIVDSVEAVRKVVSLSTSYVTLPMVYNSFVETAVLHRIREQTGRLFVCASPDVYSGLAVTQIVDRYANSGVPLGIAGQHGGSNGLNQKLNRGKTAVAKDYHRMNADSDCAHHHPTMCYLPAISVTALTDAVGWVRDMFKVQEGLCIHGDRLVYRLIRQMATNTVSREEWEEWMVVFRDAIRAGKWSEGSGGSTGALAFVAANSEAAYEEGVRRKAKGHSERLGLWKGNMVVDAATFGVSDVAGAVDLAGRLLGMPGNSPRTWDAGNRAPGGSAAAKRVLRAITPPAVWALFRKLSSSTRSS